MAFTRWPGALGSSFEPGSWVLSRCGYAAHFIISFLGFLAQPRACRSVSFWYATRLSSDGVADQRVTQLLQHRDAMVFKNHWRMKQQVKREALEEMRRGRREWSGLSESNRHLNLGKVPYYHYTKAAQRQFFL